MKPENDLEEYVKKHRQEFDMEEPSVDLWSKIEDEIGVQNDKVISIHWVKALQRAAAVLLIGGASILGYEYFRSESGVNDSFIVKVEENNSQINTDNLPVQIKEEMYYYNMRVNSSLVEFNQLTKDTPDLNKDVKRDLQELDDDMKQLLQDLKENLDNEEVLEAMIQNYRYRLQVLEDIMNEIKEAKNDDDEQSFEI